MLAARLTDLLQGVAVQLVAADCIQAPSPEWDHWTFPSVQ